MGAKFHTFLAQKPQQQINASIEQLQDRWIASDTCFPARKSAGRNVSPAAPGGVAGDPAARCARAEELMFHHITGSKAVTESYHPILD